MAAVYPGFAGAKIKMEEHSHRNRVRRRWTLDRACD
jgi:hypothetical protein